MFTVIYDACVLYPAPLRDILLQLATTDLFRARWTARIHDEWMRNALKNHPTMCPETLQRTRALMDSHVRDALITGYEYLELQLHLPDHDDRHVLAAAIHGQADAIVTFNLRDFPDEKLAPHRVEAINPDDFLMDLWDLDKARVLMSVQTVRARLKRPPLTADEYIALILRQRLPQFAHVLREFHALI